MWEVYDISGEDTEWEAEWIASVLYYAATVMIHPGTGLRIDQINRAGSTYVHPSYAVFNMHNRHLRTLGSVPEAQKYILGLLLQDETIYH